MDIASTTSARGAFERLVEQVNAAEGAFRRLVSGFGASAGGGRRLLEDAVAAERERLRLIGDGNRGYRDQRSLIEAALRAQERAAGRVMDAWKGFGDGLGDTFQRLFERILKDGELRLGDLFRTLRPLAGDLLGRLTGLDLGPILDAVGKLLGGGSAAGGLGGGALGKAAGLLGPLLSVIGPAGPGGLLGSLLGGSGGLLGSAASAIGSLLPIPGAGLIAAALPLVAGLFADKDYPYAAAGIAASGGTLSSTASELDDGPIEQIARLGEQVAQTLQEVLDQLGGTVGDLAKLTAIGYSSGRKALPEGFFAGVDATHGADFATGAVFSGIEDPEEATLRAVQAGLLHAFRTGSVTGVDPHDAATVQVGLRRAVAADFTSLQDGLADIAFLRDLPATLERLKANGDAAATQRLDLRDQAVEAGRGEAERIREFLERAARLFAPLDHQQDTEAAGVGRLAALAEEEDGESLRPITDEGRVIGFAEPEIAAPDNVVSMPEASDDEIAAERLAEARAAIDDYVRALLGIADAAADTGPLTGYALQLAEAEARLDGLSGALREAGYSAEEAAALIEQGREAARDRLRSAYADDLGRDLRGAQGLGVVDRVSDLVEAYDGRRAEGVALGADVSGLDELLRRQVEQLAGAGTVSVAALEALRTAFAGNAIVSDALAGALSLQTAAANDNAAAQLTLADVTRLATRELDAQIREQEEIKRSAQAVVEAIADSRRRLALDPALSALSPGEQLDVARRDFEDLSARALAGDQAAQGELPEAAEAYLELARDFYASNEDYARIFRQVDDALRDTGALADRQLVVAEQQLEELRELRRALTGEIGDLPDASADFGHNPTRNRILARLTGYAGDFGGGGFGTFRAGLSPEINALVEAIASSINFADGGVMTAAGPLDLHRYATGGIARSPQLALFGEGRMPEAFVPLPDGRSIPVTMAAVANDRDTGEADTGAARRTAGIETLVEETRRLRADLAGLRADNATLRRGLERLAAGVNTGRAA